jgi:pyruvate kinase
MSIRKHSKIYGKISDLKCDVDFIKAIYDKGFNVVWLNTAHQEEEDTIKVIENTRKVSEDLSIIIDTKGPEIRIHGIEEENPFPVKEGQIVYLTGNTELEGDDIVHVDYPTFAAELEVGKQILIDDGEIGLTVEAIEGDKVKCHVDNTGGGKIKRKKSVNVPDTHFENLQSLTEKDKRYIEFAAQNDQIDYVIHSFVRSKDDVMKIREILDKYDTQCGIIAKIENIAGVENVLNGEILDVVDGIMVARGDLAVEVPAPEVPIVQKKMIKEALKRGVFTITATQALHTMIENPRPTRAELSDVVNGILDGSDAMSLSGETAYGDYPVESVDFMARAMVSAEVNRRDVAHETEKISMDLVEGKVALSAAEVGRDSKAFIVPTTTNRTVRALATIKMPQFVYAVSDNKMTLRQAEAHSYGTESIYAEGSREEKLVKALDEVLKREEITENDQVTIVDADDKDNTYYHVDTVANFKEQLSK